MDSYRYAAYAALLVSHADIVSPAGLRWSLGAVALSLLAGVVCKQVGAVVPPGMAAISELEQFLASDQGRQILNHTDIPLEQLPLELSEPFLWPLSTLMRYRMRKPFDRLANDKLFALLFSVQILAFWLHTISAIASIVVVALNIVARQVS